MYPIERKSEMAQWVTAPVTKPEDLRSIHEATMAEERPDSTNCPRTHVLNALWWAHP